MKRLIILCTAATAILASCVKDRIQPPVSNVINTAGDSLIYFWDFNVEDSADRSPAFNAGGATTTYHYYSSYIDFTTGSGINLRTGFDTGSCLRVRNPSDSVIFVMPTTGYKDVVMQFAEQRSSSGPSINAISYTTDGVHYITTAINGLNTYTVDTAFSLHAFNFASDANTNNNAKFAVKILFSNNNTGASGNDRFDNVSLEGIKE
jgi:hypothetical protein